MQALDYLQSLFCYIRSDIYNITMMSIFLSIIWYIVCRTFIPLSMWIITPTLKVNRMNVEAKKYLAQHDGASRANDRVYNHAVQTMVQMAKMKFPLAHTRIVEGYRFPSMYAQISTYLYDYAEEQKQLGKKLRRIDVALLRKPNDEQLTEEKMELLDKITINYADARYIDIRTDIVNAATFTLIPTRVDTDARLLLATTAVGDVLDEFDSMSKRSRILRYLSSLPLIGRMFGNNYRFNFHTKQ